MILNMVGGSGGIGGLNFQVVGGTTQPASPRENTIWVNTDVPITGYCFDNDGPDDPAEGSVWFTTGTNSSAPFSAAKDFSLMIYPDGCFQYVGGQWMGRSEETLIYRNGNWDPIAHVLFYKGVITPPYEPELFFSKGLTTEIIDGELVFHGTGTGWRGIFWKRDLTKYRYLQAVGTWSRASNQLMNYLAVYANPGGTPDINRLAYVDTVAGMNTLTLDVSAVSGEVYVAITTTYTEQQKLNKLIAVQ